MNPDLIDFVAPSVPWWVVLVSHALIGLAGYWTGMMVTERTVAAQRREEPMKHHNPFKRMVLGAPTRGFVLILVFLAIIIALAFQSHAAQRAQRERNLCLTQWGQELTQVLEARVEANQWILRRSFQRSNSLDNLLLIAIRQSELREQSRPDRTAAEQAQMDHAVRDYRRSIARLRAVNMSAERVRANNPYPTLNCR